MGPHGTSGYRTQVAQRNPLFRTIRLGRYAASLMAGHSVFTRPRRYHFLRRGECPERAHRVEGLRRMTFVYILRCADNTLTLVIIEFELRGYRVRQLGPKVYFVWTLGANDCRYEERTAIGDIQFAALRP